jgi:hypothetical protein
MAKSLERFVLLFVIAVECDGKERSSLKAAG